MYSLRKALKSPLFWFFYTLKPSLRSGACILMYHSISDRSDYFSSVSPKEFARQMEYLKDRNIPIISLSELARRVHAKEKIEGAVVLTFDDGYRDNYTNAFPILKRFNFPATIFVTTGALGRPDKSGVERLSESELRELEGSGLIDIQPHSKSHPKLAGMPFAEAFEEISGSRNAVERIIPKKAVMFAYPFGSYNEETLRAAGEAGIVSAVSVERGFVTADSNPMLLRRNSVDSSTTFLQFKAILSDGYALYLRLKRIFA